MAGRPGTFLAQRAGMCPSSAPGTTLPPFRVLVVDGDAPSARLLRAVLPDDRFAVHVALTGAEALRLARSFKPELVLLELVLPDMDGLELVRILKSDASSSNAVIVVVTASNGPERERLALDAGCAEFLRKPIDVLSLPQRLLSHLGNDVESSRGTTKGGSAD